MRAPTTLEVYLLGRFRVVLNGRELPENAWRRRKARQLLKCLLTRPRRRLSQDEAIELFWPESGPEAGAQTVRATLSSLRGALRDAGGDGGLIVVDGGTISIRTDGAVWSDADAFEGLLAQSNRAAESSALLEEADALYVGDYLPDDLDESWASDRRERLRQLWSRLQLALGAQREQAGNVEGALAALRRAVQADPCDERAASALIELLGRQGDRSEAVQVYDRLAQSLRERLDSEPSEPLARRRAELAAPTTRARPGDDAGRLDRPDRFSPSYPFPSPARLIGRASELARLEEILARGRAAGQVVLIGAPAGTGKSALTGALCRRAQRAGVLSLVGGCYEQEGLVPFGPFRDAMADYLLAQDRERLGASLGALAADLAQIVPELRYHLRLDIAAGQPVEQGPLFGAVHAFLRALAESCPLLVCLEDLHVADAATLDLLRFLARQIRRLPLVVVGTFRSDEVRPGGPLARLLTTLTREGAEQIRLTPLNRAAMTRLASTLLDGSTSNGLSSWLYATTEGNPLFVEQLLLTLREEEQIDQRDGVWHQSGETSLALPTIIREVIRRRLDRQSARCRDTLAVAAVLGRTFDYEALRDSLERGDEIELAEDLEAALAAQLLQETPSGYAFSHALLRDVIYQELGTPRRRHLHARVGRALERLAGARVLEQAAVLAHHFAEGGDGPDIRAASLRYRLEAGRHAAALSAHGEARHHFERAWEAVERAGAEVDADARLRALEGRGQAERNLGMWQRCVESLRGVLDLTDDPTRRARAREAIGRALFQLGDTAGALAAWNAGLADLVGLAGEPEAEVLRLQLLYQSAFPPFLLGRYDEVERLGQEMVAAAERLGRPGPLFWAHGALALAYMGRGQIEQTLEQHARALAAAERGGSKLQIAVAHENLGLQSYRGGLFEEAVPQLEQAIAIYRESVSDLRTVMSLQTLGRVRLAQGDLAGAARQAELACALAIEGQDRWAAECHDLLGAIHALRAEWDEAESSFDRALAIREKVGHAAGLAESLVGLGLVHERRGGWTRAGELYRRALDVATTMDASPHAVAAHRQLGRWHLRRGEIEAAAEHIERAYRLAEAIPRSLEYGPTLLAMSELESARSGGGIEQAERAVAAVRVAELKVEAHAAAAAGLVAAGRHRDAGAHAAAGRAIAARVGAPRLHGLAELAAGRVEAARGDVGALATLAAALDQFARARTPYERAVTLREYGQATSRLRGDVARAREMEDEAAAILGQLGARPDRAYS